MFWSQVVFYEELEEMDITNPWSTAAFRSASLEAFVAALQPAMMVWGWIFLAISNSASYLNEINNYFPPKKALTRKDMLIYGCNLKCSWKNNLHFSEELAKLIDHSLRCSSFQFLNLRWSHLLTQGRITHFSNLFHSNFRFRVWQCKFFHTHKIHTWIQVSIKEQNLARFFSMEIDFRGLSLTTKHTAQCNNQEVSCKSQLNLESL